MHKAHIHLIFILSLIFSQGNLIAQEWEFVKEKDGIKIYTRHEPGTNFKSFKGEMDVKADVSTVCSLIEDVESFTKCDEDVDEIRVLEQEKGKMLRYYVVYNVPWPFKDRDLCVEATITDDQSTGAKLILAKAAPDAVPLVEDIVRIANYWQNWIIQPLKNGMVHVTIEGFVDPAGDVPAWIANLAITDTPFNMLGAIEEMLKSPNGSK
jgi:hypothetical protein